MTNIYRKIRKLPLQQLAKRRKQVAPPEHNAASVQYTQALPNTRGQTTLFQSSGRQLRHQDGSGNVTWQLLDMTVNGQRERKLRQAVLTQASSQ